MASILLDVLYGAGLAAASPWLLYKMATQGKYRRGLGERLGFVMPRGGRPWIFVHGVSVGEILAARGIIAGLEAAHPNIDIVISATTDTGLAVAKKNFPGKRVIHFPLDFSRAVARTFRRVRPGIVILMEAEVWPNFVARAKRLGVPVIVANGRVTERSARRMARFGWVARRFLSKVTLYLVQTDEYRMRLVSLGVPEAMAAGNVKVDTLSTDLDANRAAELRRQLGVASGDSLIIGGSTHEGEEAALLEAYSAMKPAHPRVRLLIVPRHNTRFEEVAALIKAGGFKLFRRSQSLKGARPEGDEVILGDTMGELESLYEAADVAFVGGTLIRHGGQNILEPAAKGKPVVFGPSIHNFAAEAQLLAEAGAATRIESAAGLAEALSNYLNVEEAVAAGGAGREAIINAKGATARNLWEIEKVISSM